MRHNHGFRKLNKTAAHRKAMLRNMVTSLFDKERITTTTAKAKEARRVAERMITFAKKGDLASRRQVAKTVQNPRILKKLFDEIGPRFESRPGGYTRVMKLGERKGDNAETSILELVGENDKPRGKKKKPMKKYHNVEIPGDPVEAANIAAKEAEEKAAVEAKAAEEAAKKAEEEAAAAAEAEKAEAGSEEAADGEVSAEDGEEKK